MPTKRIPLAGTHTQRTIDAQTQLENSVDQQFLNCVFGVVRNPITGKSTLYVEKRPGWGVKSVVEAGSLSTGLIHSDGIGTDISAFGIVNSTIYDGTTSVGAITGKALHFSETILSGTAYVLIKSSDGTAWYYASGGTATLIADGDFVTTGTTISAFVEMDGYLFYVNADGFVYNSDLNSITAYTSTNKIAANMHPDTPLAIAKHKNMILVFGIASMEAFYNAGNSSGSPLLRAEQHFQLVGIQNQRSLTRLMDDIYFASSSREGDVHIMRLRGMATSKVSTPEVDRILGTASPFSSDVHLSGFSLGGYSYIAVVVFSAAAVADSYLALESDFLLLMETADDLILDADVTAATGISRMLFYNVELNIWGEWDSTVMTYIRGSGSGSLNQIIATSRLNTGGKIYQMNPSGDGALYQDDGVNYDMIIRTTQLDHGTRQRKIIKRISLMCDKSTGNVTLEKSDDDYVTWQTIGTFDTSTMQPTLKGAICGSHAGFRAYKLTHAGNSRFRAQALDIEYEVAEL